MSFNLAPMSDLTPSLPDMNPTSISDLAPSQSNTGPTLESLQQYTSRQMEVIEPLFDPSHYCFQDSNNIDWVGLWRSAWDKDPRTFEKTEVVERGRNPINDSRIIVPPLRDVMLTPEAAKLCWNFKFKFAEIFIRPDYKEAEEFLISSCGVDIRLDGILVVGQPGIGKSIFLLRLLLRRLAHKLPTALQTESGLALLFYEKGVKEFTQLKSPAPYSRLASWDDPQGRIWALIDSNQGLQEPAMVFQEGPFFVVQTSSPRPAYCEWFWNVTHDAFYMKPWSLAEVLQARSLFNPVASEKELWNMHYLYGASFRDLIKFAHQPNIYDAMVNEGMKRLSPLDFSKLLRTTEDTVNGCNLLVSTGPLPTRRDLPERKVISPYVLERICDQVLKNNVKEMKDLYQSLQNRPTTAAAVEMIFKYQVHRFLRKRRTIKLLPIDSSNGRVCVWATGTEVVEEKFRLPKSEELVFTDKPDTPLEVGTYYRPRNNNFPTIDSWLLVRLSPQELPVLIAFHIAPNKDTCDVDRSGLATVDELVDAGTKKYLVVVTPAGVELKMTMSGEYPTSPFLAYHLEISDEALF